MSLSAVCIAILPIEAVGAATVVSGGDQVEAAGISSKPTTLKAAGIDIPLLSRREMTPNAIRSL
jgi:hypothetical protein